MVTWPIQTRAAPKAKEKRMAAVLRTQDAITKPSPHLSSLGEEQEEPQFLHSQNSTPNIPFIPAPSVPPPTLAYSLSSGAARIARSRSKSRSHPTPPSSSSFISPSSSLLSNSSSFFDGDTQSESAHSLLPPINPSDYFKSLLSQLAASISAMNTAYARQQAAFNPYNMQRRRESVSAHVSVADKAIMEEFKRLSHIQSKLSLLPHMKQDQCQCKSTCKVEGADLQQEAMAMMGESMMLKQYEGIITRFHDEIRTKDAVTMALKETLAKSMLRGEKLEQRVKALETQLRAHS